jgi:hypothetical protein
VPEPDRYSRRVYKHLCMVPVPDMRAYYEYEEEWYHGFFPSLCIEADFLMYKSSARRRCRRHACM